MNERISAVRRWVARAAAALALGLGAHGAWAAPSFTSTPPAAGATEDAVYTYNITTTDPQAGNRLVTATVLPTWLTLSNQNQNQGTARISGTPTQAQVGVPQAVTLLVRNTTTNLTATQSFTITVANVNDAPTFTSAAVTAATQGSVYTYNITTADPDPSDTRTITATTLPSWLTLNNVNPTAGTATLTGTPAQAQVGSHSVTLRVTDNGSPTLFATQTFTITVANVNDAPTFTSTPPATGSQGALYTYSVTTADPDTGNTRTVSVAPGTTLPTWLTLGNANPTAGTATLSGTPGQANIGVHNVTLRVTDNGSPVLFTNQAFTITVNNTNDPPTFASVPITAATEDVLYTYSVTTADPDTGDTRTISVGPGTTLPAWLTLTNVNPAAGTATLSGTPLQANAGANSVTLRVTDNGTPTPLFATQTFTITVANANDPPRIVAPIPAQLAVENTPFQLLSATGTPTTLAAFFADDDVGAVLTYQVTGLPPGGGLVANSTTGAITGTPLAAAARDTPYPIQVTASDGVSLPAALPTQTFNLTVSRLDRADVSVTTAVAPAPALRNVNVDWTFTVANAGPQTTSPITFTAEFAGNPFSFTTLGTCSVTPAGDRQVVSCTVPALAAAASSQIVISGQAAQAGDVHVTADARGAAATPVDPNLTNNRASTTLNVAQALTSGPAQLLASPDNLSAATGDFDRDGFIDLALTKSGATGTEVYLNVESTINPSQRMLSTSPRLLGDQIPSTDVLAADLDNDGDLDLVTTNNTGLSNNVFLNSGGAAFNLFATLGAGDSNAAAAGDFNGDGLVDLAFANATAATVHLNGPGPAFAAGIPVGAGNMRELVVADFDLDGLPDLALANAAGPSRFQKNLGAGQFAAGVVVDSGGAESLASADFNGDGRPDLALARASTAVMPPSIVVYQNNPGGTAPLFVIVANLGASPIVDVLAGDVDLDGFADIVAIGVSGTHQVYRGNGAGGFSLHPTQFLLAGATGAAFGKLSVDDRVDLAVAGTAGAGIFVNDGRGGLGPGDTDRPVITLLGETSAEVEIGAAYQDAGATATDQIDGNLTSRIETNNPVNTRIVGNYTVTYDVRDNSGNAAARVSRSVRVGPREGTGGGGGGAIGGPLTVLGLLLCLAGRLRRQSRSRAC